MKKLLLILCLFPLVLMAELKTQVKVDGYYQPNNGKVVIIEKNDTLPANLEKIGIVSVGDSKSAGDCSKCNYFSCITTLEEEVKKIGGTHIKIVDVFQPNGVAGICYTITANVYIKK